MLLGKKKPKFGIPQESYKVDSGLPASPSVCLQVQCPRQGLLVLDQAKEPVSTKDPMLLTVIQSIFLPFCISLSWQGRVGSLIPDSLSFYGCSGPVRWCHCAVAYAPERRSLNGLFSLTLAASWYSVSSAHSIATSRDRITLRMGKDWGAAD